MTRNMLLGAMALALLICTGCKDDPKPAYVESQYTVQYLGFPHDRTRIGELSDSLSGGDFYGFCGATKSGDHRTINVLVADPSTWPTPAWKIEFRRIEWDEGSTASVTCDHVEFCDDTVCANNINCGGGTDGTCQITVARNEDSKHTVQIFFNCTDFETNVSTGGEPNLMTIESGMMQIQNCDGF